MRRARDEVEAIALTAMRRRWGGVADGARLDELGHRVAGRDLDPYAAADLLLDLRGQDQGCATARG